MSWLSGNYEITAEATAAYNAAKGLAGEQPPAPDCEHCDDTGCEDCRIICACVAEFLHGVDPHCPACDGTGQVKDRNEWCSACGLTGRCPDCDPDTDRDTRDDR